MKKIWTIICVELVVLWGCPFTMVLLGGFLQVTIPNVTERNFLYTFWFNPLSEARQGNWYGYLPSLIWIALIWVIGILVIWSIQRIKRKFSK